MYNKNHITVRRLNVVNILGQKAPDVSRRWLWLCPLCTVVYFDWTASSSQARASAFLFCHPSWSDEWNRSPPSPPNYFFFSVCLFFFSKPRAQTSQKKERVAAVWETRNQTLSRSCVCGFTGRDLGTRGISWGTEKALSHGQCHRGAEEEVK